MNEYKKIKKIILIALLVVSASFNQSSTAHEQNALSNSYQISIAMKRLDPEIVGFDLKNIVMFLYERCKNMRDKSIPAGFLALYKAYENDENEIDLDNFIEAIVFIIESLASLFPETKRFS